METSTTIIGTAVATVGTFEDRMRDRIKESIGDMITDDELAKIVARGIEASFFGPTYEPGYYGGMQIKKEPLVTTILKECMKKKVDEAVKEWFESSPDILKELLDSAIRDGLTRVVLQAFDSKLQNALSSFGTQVYDTIRNNMNR